MRHVVFLAATTFYILSTASLASANEVMTDRCSAEVAIVPSYNARPNTPGTVVLTRDSSGNTAWSSPFSPHSALKLSQGETREATELAVKAGKSHTEKKI